MVTALHRTLDQELLALARGASLECLVCGEFVLHVLGAISCPECGCVFSDAGRAACDGAGPSVESGAQAG